MLLMQSKAKPLRGETRQRPCPRFAGAGAGAGAGVLGFVCLLLSVVARCGVDEVRSRREREQMKARVLLVSPLLPQSLLLYSKYPPYVSFPLVWSWRRLVESYRRRGGGDGSLPLPLAWTTCWRCWVGLGDLGLILRLAGLVVEVVVVVVVVVAGSWLHGPEARTR